MVLPALVLQKPHLLRQTASSIAFLPTFTQSFLTALIRSTSLRTKGAAGPSGLDAYAWRRLCTSFKGTVASPHCKTPMLGLCGSSFYFSFAGMPAYGTGQKSRSQTNWHRRNPQENNCKGSPAPDEKRYSGCHWFSPAVCWTDSRSRGSRPRRTRVFSPGRNGSSTLGRCQQCLQLPNPRGRSTQHSLCMSVYIHHAYRVPTVLFMDGEEIYSREGTTRWLCPCMLSQLFL